MALIGDLTVSILKRSANVKVRAAMCMTLMLPPSRLTRGIARLVLIMAMPHCRVAGHWISSSGSRWATRPSRLVPACQCPGLLLCPVPPEAGYGVPMINDGALPCVHVSCFAHVVGSSSGALRAAPAGHGPWWSRRATRPARPAGRGTRALAGSGAQQPQHAHNLTRTRTQAGRNGRDPDRPGHGQNMGQNANETGYETAERREGRSKTEVPRGKRVLYVSKTTYATPRIGATPLSQVSHRRHSRARQPPHAAHAARCICSARNARARTQRNTAWIRVENAVHRTPRCNTTCDQNRLTGRSTAPSSSPPL